MLTCDAHPKPVLSGPHQGDAVVALASRLEPHLDAAVDLAGPRAPTGSSLVLVMSTMLVVSTSAPVVKVRAGDPNHCARTQGRSQRWWPSLPLGG